MCNVILEILWYDNSDGNNDVKVLGWGYWVVVDVYVKGL